MKRILVFLGLFLSSTAVVIWGAGGIAPPPVHFTQPSDEPMEETSTGPMMPVDVAEARGLSIGVLRGTTLDILEEIETEEGYRVVPRARFRFDEVEPLSRESVRVTGPRGTFFDDEGRELARVESRKGILRMQERESRVSIIELEDEVLLEERIEEGASLLTDRVVIELDQSRGKPSLRAPDRVEIRKPGLVVSGTGFRGDTVLNNFELDRAVHMELARDSDLLLPDLLSSVGGGDEAGSEGNVVIDSPGGFRLQVIEDPEAANVPEGSRSAWGVSDAKLEFVDRTYLTRGSQNLEAGRLGIRLHWEPDPADPEGGGRFVARRFDAGGDVQVSDERLALRCGELTWSAGDGPGDVRFRGAPSLVLVGVAGSSLLAGDVGSGGSASSPSDETALSIRAGDEMRIVPTEAGDRRLLASGGVSVRRGLADQTPPGPGPAPAATDVPGLTAQNLAVTIENRDADGLALGAVEAWGDVRIRDPQFLLSGGRFSLLQDPSGTETLAMSEQPLLELSGDSLGDFDLDVAPSDAAAVAPDGTGPAPGLRRIEARAGESIVLTRSGETETEVSFRGGFEMRRFEGSEVTSSLSADSMNLRLLRRSGADGSTFDIAGWDATGNIVYDSPESTASGSFLSFFPAPEDVVILTGIPARVLVRSNSGEEPQTLEARTIRYDRRSGHLRAAERVIGRFVTEIDLAREIEPAPDGASPAPARSPLVLECDLAEVGFRKEERDGVERSVLSTFDAIGNVRVTGDEYRAEANQVSYTEDDRLVTVLGAEGAPAVASLRNPDHPDEWDSLTSRRILVHTDEERIACPDGGVLRFHLEDLLGARRPNGGGDGESKAPERYPTTVTARKEISFLRNKEIRFTGEVRAVQADAEGKERSLEADEFRAEFERVEAKEPADPNAPKSDEFRIRRAEADGNVRLDHPKILADADVLILLPKRETVRVEGRRRHARIRTSQGPAEASWIEYNYQTGEWQVGPFAGGVTPEERKTP